MHLYFWTLCKDEPEIHQTTLELLNFPSFTSVVLITQKFFCPLCEITLRCGSNDHALLSSSISNRAKTAAQFPNTTVLTEMNYWSSYNLYQEFIDLAKGISTFYFRAGDDPVINDRYFHHLLNLRNFLGDKTVRTYQRFTAVSFIWTCTALLTVCGLRPIKTGLGCQSHLLIYIVLWFFENVTEIIVISWLIPSCFLILCI